MGWWDKLGHRKSGETATTVIQMTWTGNAVKEWRQTSKFQRYLAVESGLGADRMWRIGRRGVRNDRLSGFWLGKPGCMGCHDLRYKTLEEKTKK